MTKDEKWLLEEKYGGVEGPGFEADKERLAEGEPVAYVIEWMPFLGLRIYLDSRPLIPRPETEWWTEVLIEHLKEKFEDKEFRFLDLCAGSGAIGCAVLAAFPNAHVSFGEIVPEHKATIEKNIEENVLDASRSDIRIGNLFTHFEGDTFEVIATNPPYIPEDRELEASVTDWEPPIALRSGKDGMDLILQIGNEAGAYIKPQGEVWLECDAEYAEQTKEAFLKGDLPTESVEIRTDQYGRPRIVVGYYS
jgi:release factor glutamine methyltransferase